jgi:uncharacterized protein (TIGR02145 family)
MSYTWTLCITLFLIWAALSGCKSLTEKESSGEQVSDIEGNAYAVIQIGKQSWMAENLLTRTLSDGTPIARVEGYDEWASLTTPAYCWYNNDSANMENFGALYNYYTIETGKLCPDGWRVPTDEDWIELESFLGGASLAGGAMKESGTEHWKTPNTLATNESGFTALPGGYRSYNGTFNLQRINAYWWSSSEKNWYGASGRVVFRNLQYKNQELFRHVAEKTNGFSVRCVKNP